MATAASPSPISLTIGESVTYDITPLKELKTRQDYNAVIKSKELFWLAFCKSASSVFIEDTELLFQTAVNDQQLIVSAKRYNRMKIEKAVEKTRAFVVRAFEEQTRIVMIAEKQAGGINIGDTDKIYRQSERKSSKKKLIHEDYFQIINGIFPHLVKSLGGEVTEMVIDKGSGTPRAYKLPSTEKKMFAITFSNPLSDSTRTVHFSS